MYALALSPVRIGAVEVPNRVARTAHATMMARGGAITEELVAYHLARARGGVGLTILEAAGVHRSSVLSLANLDDGIIDGYRALARAVAPTGMKVSQQLWHGGHIYPAPDGSPPWAPSTVPSHIAGVAPRAMTGRQARELIAGYGLGDFTVRTASRVAAVREGSVDIAPQFAGRVETFPADTVVWVGIRGGQGAFAEALEDAGLRVVVVGDALAGRTLQTAIREGHLAARALSVLQAVAVR